MKDLFTNSNGAAAGASSRVSGLEQSRGSRTFKTGLALAMALAGGLVSITLQPVPAAADTRPPVRFERDSDDRKVKLRIHRKDLTRLSVSRTLFARGKRVKETSIPVEYRGKDNVDVPLDAGDLQTLPDGLYSQIVDTQVDLPDRNQPVRAQHVMHFSMTKGKLRRLSLEEYSEQVQPSVLSVDRHGKPVLVRGGSEAPANPADLRGTSAAKPLNDESE